MVSSTKESQKASCFEKDVENCIMRLARNDISAMEQLYPLVKNQVYGFALSILKSKYDSEDAMQECFIKIYRSASLYRSKGKPLAWILTITKNLCYEILSKKNRTVDCNESEERADSNDYINKADDKMVLKACMKILTPEERQIVYLHALCETKHKDIAKLLNIPISTALSKYNRAIKKIQKYLGGEK